MTLWQPGICGWNCELCIIKFISSVGLCSFLFHNTNTASVYSIAYQTTHVITQNTEM
jgi:hypothetical protein